MGERKRESCSESKSLIIEKDAENCKQKDMLKQRKNTYSLHDYTNDLLTFGGAIALNWKKGLPPKRNTRPKRLLH